jgi:hypothetical protein
VEAIIGIFKMWPWESYFWTEWRNLPEVSRRRENTKWRNNRSLRPDIYPVLR